MALAATLAAMRFLAIFRQKQRLAFYGRYACSTVPCARFNFGPNICGSEKDGHAGGGSESISEGLADLNGHYSYPFRVRHPASSTRRPGLHHEFETVFQGTFLKGIQASQSSERYPLSAELPDSTYL